MDISQALEKINLCTELSELDQIKTSLFGKNGVFTLAMKDIAKLDIEKRKQTGQDLNVQKQEVLKVLDERRLLLNQQALDKKLKQQSVDVSIPISTNTLGRVHPISYVMRELMGIMSNLGYTFVDGPEIEDEWHNFSALNFEDNHAARDMQDTFYLKKQDEKSKKLVLRTHTSSVQIRHLIEKQGATKIISLGRTYRSDHDATHSPMFHQMEGLWIGQGANLPALIGTLRHCCERFFVSDHVNFRVRSSYFPFTSPSMEVDIGYSINQNSKIEIGGKNTDKYLEILGCGMVHDNVISNCGLDPKKYKGFAFGMGVERMAMLKYGFDDLRSFYSNNTQWLSNNAFQWLDTIK